MITCAVTRPVGQWKCNLNCLVYLHYPLVHAVNVSDSKEVSNRDTDSNVVKCESLQDCVCRSVTNATVYTVIVHYFEIYLDVATVYSQKVKLYKIEL